MPDNLTAAAMIEAMARAISGGNRGGPVYEVQARDALAAMLRLAQGDGCWPDIDDGHVRGTDFPRITLYFAEGDYDTRDRFAALLRALAEVSA